MSVLLLPESVHAQTTSPSAQDCTTRTVIVTLAGESIRFCAPDSQPATTVEDNTSDQFSSYASYDQIGGLAYINIRSTLPGHAPGIGSPVYQAGTIDQYRRDAAQLESARIDRIAAPGPIGIFWGQPITGLQLNTALTGTDNRQVISVEWDVEHSGRLWTFVIAWDAQLANAGDWTATSQHFAISPLLHPVPDSAVDLGALKTANSQNTTIESAGSAIGDVSTPSWWSSTCDDTNYFPVATVHATVLSTWHNLYACGPRPYTVTTPDRNVRFYSGAWGEYEFECVELVMRWLYLEWGIPVFSGNGNTIKNHLPSSTTFYPNGTQSIVPGDVITENASQKNPAGHTAVITAVNLDSSGNGTVSILEQNASSAGSRSLLVRNWTVNPDGNGVYQQTIQGWIHVLNNVPTNTPAPTATPTHTFTLSATATLTPTSPATATATITPTFTLTSTLTPIGAQNETIGIYRGGVFYLRLSNSTGPADLTIAFNPATSPYPVVGDWMGTGFDTIGVFEQTSAVFTMCRFNDTIACANPSNVFSATLGSPGDQPLAGKWQPNAASDSIGIFRAANGIFGLKNEPSTGFPDETEILGLPGDLGVVGDWTGKGYDSPGIYRPDAAAFYLSNRVTNGAVFADLAFSYGVPGDLPIVGDWNAQGHDGVGLFRQSNGLTYLRNELTTGFADLSFTYGVAGDVPIAGRWSVVAPAASHLTP